MKILEYSFLHLFSLGIMMTIIYLMAPVNIYGLFDFFREQGFFDKLFLCLFVYAGILSQSLYSEIKSVGEDFNIKDTLKNTIKTRSFWLAIAVSPFILLIVLNSSTEMPGGVVSLTFAFQNGFFFDNVFKIVDKE